MWFDEVQARHLFSLAPEDLNNHRVRVKNPGGILSFARNRGPTP